MNPAKRLLAFLRKASLTVFLPAPQDNAVPQLPASSCASCRSAEEPASLIPSSFAQWSAYDVLVGSLGSAEQLWDNLNGRYYYVPARTLEKNCFPIRYIALYQSRRLFGDDAGVRYYGEVTLVRRLRRRQIRFPMRKRNGNEWYYAFRVRSWEMLPDIVIAKGEGVLTPRFTNLFLLFHCAKTWELFQVHSEEEYFLLRDIENAMRQALYYGEKNIPFVYQLSGGSVWFGKNGVDFRIGCGKRIFTHPVAFSELSENPDRYFRRIADALCKTDE